MDKQIKKKLKIVLIAFAILTVPLGYLIAISFSVKIHDDALEKAMVRFPNDKNIIKESIRKIDNAIMIYPWNYLFRMNKAQLQMRINDYRGALISAKKGTDLREQYAEGLEYIGMIYEYLNQPDSAKIYYSKAIDKYKKRFEDKKGNAMISKEIALLYIFVGDSINARKYLYNTSSATESDIKNIYDQFDFYIENYKSGGLKDFLHGETVQMVNDSIIDNSKIDSLLKKNRIYSSSIDGVEILRAEGKEKIYTFRKLFKNKAESIGFKEIKE